MLAGCGGGGPASPSDNNPPSPPYNIYGVVRSSDGSPLSDALVTAVYEDAPDYELARYETKADGKYYLWVPWVSSERAYLITAERTGFQKQTVKVSLSSSDDKKEVNFSLSPQ